MNEWTDKPKTQFDGVWFTKNNDRVAESAEQDQAARMWSCSIFSAKRQKMVANSRMN